LSQWVSEELWIRIFEFVLADVSMVSPLKRVNKQSKALVESVFDHSYQRQLPLVHNCKRGYVDEVRRLLQDGKTDPADPEIAISPFCTVHEPIADLLLAHPAVVRGLRKQDLNYACAAGSAGVVSRLLHHLSPNNDALVAAARAGEPEVVKLLLKEDSRRGTRGIDSEGTLVALVTACMYGFANTVDVLLFAEGADVNPEDPDLDPLWQAVCHGMTSTVKKVLRHPK
jgi:hypothetical protein